MAIITDAVMERLTDERVTVFFLSRTCTKWWNARRSRKDSEVALLGGWYWALGKDEAGPFRTPSAAWRDVYYRRVLKEAPPSMSQSDIKTAEDDEKKAARKPLKKYPQKAKPKNSVIGNVLRLRRQA